MFFKARNFGLSRNNVKQKNWMSIEFNKWSQGKIFEEKRMKIEEV